MTYNRDKKQDIKNTKEHIENKDQIVRKEKSWLDHTSGAAEIDYDLLQGATLDQMMKSSGRQKGSVKNHFPHLETEHGIKVVDENGLYKIEIDESIKTDPNSNLQQKNITENKKADKRLKNLIETYKEHIQKSQLEDELYKWQFIQDYKGKPDVNAANFQEEIKSIKWGNLVYALSGGVVNHLAKKKPEELRGEFKKLFDESTSLEDRIKHWEKNIKKLYKSIGETLGHHQDERAVSVYLTLQDSEKYTFYKNSYYKKFCDLLGIKTKRKGKKYVHYLELIKNFVDDYISKDPELIDLVASFLPEECDNSNYLLIAQDILYQMLEMERATGYWVFQSNPKIWDLRSALKNNEVDRWTVSSHKDDIKIGDKVILWLTGETAGCYALAEVSEDPISYEESKDKTPWGESDNKNHFKAGVKVTHNLFEAPILYEDIKNIPVLSDLNIGFAGTNFSATKVEYNTLLNMISNKPNIDYWLFQPGENAIMWDEFYDKGFMAIGWDLLGDLKKYKTRDEIGDALRHYYGGEGSKKNDISANDDFVNKMKIGDVVFVKKGRRELLGYGLVVSDYLYDDTKNSYKSVRKVEWKLKGHWQADVTFVVKTLTDVTKYSSEHPDYDTYYERLFGIMGQTQTNKISIKKMEPINRILYGPPGTGKTFRLKDTYFEKYTTPGTSVTKEKNFENVVAKLSWWQVIGLALLELEKAKVSDIIQNRWVVQKSKLSEAANIRPIMWSQLQSHSILESEQVNVKTRQAPLIFDKTKDSYWEIIEEEVKELAPELYDMLESVDNFVPRSDQEIKRYTFTTFHQSFAYEDFIEGIKPVIASDQDENSDLAYEIQNGVFKELCIEAQNDPENKYAIFIDEINRGNVSNIFGELITLIEYDKRAGADNQMSAILPYSKKKFSVPNNVDIYGTMNTADRSVEALDTALRRRFSFQEIMPNPNLLDEEIEGISLKEVLITINDRVEVLIDRDHTIGHSYFMGVNTADELQLVFKDKIIPLLQEYFYGDYGKIGLVLGKGFVEFQTKKENLFANFSYERKDELNNGFYKLIDINEGFSIIEALDNLIYSEESEV